MKRSETKVTLQPTELWQEFDYYDSPNERLPYEDIVTSHKGNKKFWKEFYNTPAFVDDTLEAPELNESIAFKLQVQRILAEVSVGNNDHQVYLDRSRYIAEQLGLVNEDTDPALLEKAHQAYYLAFRLADVDFIDGSGEVEGAFNQRALNTEGYRHAARQARERIDSDAEWERKLYTALPLFTETPAEREVASAIFSTTIMQIAHWEIDQSSIGEVKRLGLWHLRQRFGALATEIAKEDASWAETIARVEETMNAA